MNIQLACNNKLHKKGSRSDYWNNLLSEDLNSLGCNNYAISREMKPTGNPWSPGGMFMIQRMAVTSSIPVF